MIVITSVAFLRDNSAQNPIAIAQWTTFEIGFLAQNKYDNPYTDTEVWAWFVNNNGDSLVRPAFWDGGNSWKLRFTPPDTGHIWNWSLHSSIPDKGFYNKTGKLESVPYKGENKLTKHGLLQMSTGKRNVIHADGTPFLLVGDTPWAIPFRATTDQVEIYAADRRRKGFNTALIIAVQPDIHAEGPRQRNTVEGFDRGFEDIPQGHMNCLNPEYFRTLDSIILILNHNEIVPVIAPLAHGYGWKGKQSLGSSVSGEEYARFCKYLLARYGSTPLCFLISLDGHGDAPGVVPAGEALEKWDAYKQPVGLHYNPFDDFLATWAVNDSSCCYHYNMKHQAEDWLDFQWAQTGHDGKHLYHKVERMYNNKPVKAAMAGEPTYEKMNGGKYGVGWWQGEDAWNELMHGGTMGVVYGAVSLWQWKITADETGWEEWTDAPYSWRDALDFEGSNYVGAISRAFQGFDFADMEKRWNLTSNNQPLLAKEGIFYIAYLPEGGTINIRKIPRELPYNWFDPVKGIFQRDAYENNCGIFSAPDNLQPWVLVVGRRE